MEATVSAKPVHLAEFHIHSTGPCPVCYVAEAKNWDDLIQRLEKAQQIARASRDIEADVLLERMSKTVTV